MSTLDRLAENAVRAAPADLVASFVIFGSGPLAAVGIRAAIRDLDLFASGETYEELVRRGYESHVKLFDRATGEPVHHIVLVPGSGADAEPDVEVLRTFQGVSYDEVARRATRHASGMLIASLEDVRAWKCVSGRPKDLEDVAAIDRFLADGGRS